MSNPRGALVSEVLPILPRLPFCLLVLVALTSLPGSYQTGWRMSPTPLWRLRKKNGGKATVGNHLLVGHKCKKDCDTPWVQGAYNNLLSEATSHREGARLLASTTRESGAWLNALDVASWVLALMMRLSILQLLFNIYQNCYLLKIESLRCCSLFITIKLVLTLN